MTDHDPGTTGPNLNSHQNSPLTSNHPTSIPNPIIHSNYTQSFKETITTTESIKNDFIDNNKFIDNNSVITPIKNSYLSNFNQKSKNEFCSVNLNNLQNDKQTSDTIPVSEISNFTNVKGIIGTYLADPKTSCHVSIMGTPHPWTTSSKRQDTPYPKVIIKYFIVVKIK